jgi:8-oxo-dGTP diphosphatase
MVDYKHPRPALTVDIVLFKKIQGDPHVLLIKRAQSPYRGDYALPGGFVGIHEPLKAAAKRELKEETSIHSVELKQIKAFGTPGRDPRGRTISIAYGAFLSSEHDTDPRAASDAQDAGWHPLYDLPTLAFDHAEIIQTAFQALVNQEGD